MALATLSIDLVAKLAQFEADLKQAAAASKNTADQIKASFEGAGAAIEDLAKQAVSLIGIDWFVGMVDGAIKAQAELYKLSKSTQTSVEALGELQYAAQQAGVGTESVTNAMAKFNVNVAAALAGSAKASAPFIAMGISIKELKSLSPDELIQRVGEKFGTYQESANKAALANATFGRGYKDMLAVLDEGNESLKKNSEFWQQNSGVTTASAKAADELASKFGNFMLVTKSLWNHLVNELGPAMGNVLDALTNWSIKSGDAKTASESLAQLFRSLAEGVAWVVEQIRFASAEFDALRSKLLVFSAVLAEVAKSFSKTEWLTDPFGTLVKSIEITAVAMKPGLKRITDQYQAATKQITDDHAKFVQGLTATTESLNPFDNPAFGGAGNAKGNAPAVDPNAAKNAAALQKAWDAMSKSLRDAQIAADLTDTAFKKFLKTQEEIAQDPKLAAAPQALKDRWLAEAKGVDASTIAHKSQTDAVNEYIKAESAAIEVVRKLEEAQQKQVESILAQTPTQQTEALVDLEVRIRAAGYSAQTTKEMLDAMYGVKPDPALIAISELDKAVQDFAHDLNTTLGTGLQDALEGNFKGIGDAFKKMIEGMIVKATQADLADLLMGKQFAAGGSGPVGGWLGSLVGAFTGGGGLTGGGGGGTSLGITGDMLSPPIGGGGNVVNISYDIASGVSRNELASLLPTMIDQTKGAVLETMRRPGFSGG
jgi:hypothetical protein